MKCQVSVLIAQQQFFFFRRFFLLSKLSVSALFFFLTSKNVPCQMCFLINSNILFHVVFGQKIFFMFFSPFSVGLLHTQYYW